MAQTLGEGHEDLGIVIPQTYSKFLFPCVLSMQCWKLTLMPVSVSLGVPHTNVDGIVIMVEKRFAFQVLLHCQLHFLKCSHSSAPWSIILQPAIRHTFPGFIQVWPLGSLSGRTAGFCLAFLSSCGAEETESSSGNGLWVWTP